MTTATPDRPAALTARQMLLVAAQGFAGPFTTSELVVAAWRNFPDAFAMKEYPEYPDSNRVACELAGPKGLPRLGHFKRVAPRTFEMTKKGKAEATKAATTGRSSLRVAVLPESAAALARMLDSRAYQRVLAGMARYVDWPDALAFYGLQATDRGLAAGEAMEKAAVAIEDARHCLVGDRTVAVGDRQVREDELDGLDRTVRHLGGAFGKKWEWMRGTA